MSKQFVDPKNAVKFRLIHRDGNDPNQKDAPERVFQLIEDPTVSIYKIGKKRKILQQKQKTNSLTIR
jgi:hypothetical protein